MDKRKHYIRLSFLTTFMLLITMCSCSETVTMTEAEFSSNSQYAEYKQDSIKSVKYDTDSNLKLEIKLADNCYDISLFGNSKFPLNLYKEGEGCYSYRKNSQEIYVKKHGLVPYPETVFTFWGKESFEELDVDISYGDNTATGNITLETSYNDSCQKRPFLSLDSEIIEYIYYQKKNADILLKGLKIGQISIDNITKKDKKSIEERLGIKASQYNNTFTKSNLDYAYEVYKGIGYKGNFEKVQNYVNMVNQFKTFYWDQNEITENKFGKIKAGAILRNHEILFWETENKFVFGYKETKYSGDIEVPVYDNNSSIFSEKRIRLSGNEETEVTVIGMVDINGKSFNPTSTTMDDRWIAEFAGRSKVDLEGQASYLPLFKLMQKVE